MPVTIKPSAHAASTYNAQPRRHKSVSSAERLLQHTLADDNENTSSRPKKIIKSTYTELSSNFPPSFSSKNGFVHACIEAYNQHLHLHIRPEDVWFAILTQLSIYVNANAEELRHIFVSHEGQKKLEILDDTLGLDYTKWDHGELAYRMTKLIAGAIHDPEWRDWILPQFSTTTKVDQAVASVIFMGTLQNYFTYAWGTRCGLPSVTLLGTVQDWRRIRDKCKSHLPLLGRQCREWLSVLEPALDGFVQSFKEPESEKTVSFWQHIVNVHLPNGSGTTTYSGWITSFCYWNEDGACLHPSKNALAHDTKLKYNELPIGFTKVPVNLLLGLTVIPVEIVAGSLSFRASDSTKAPGTGGQHSRLDTLQPETGWIMYET
ncbi:hypothetical protein jhhlp_004683 [Lomentospora prolificans]|uniref:Uncharacterized protein n=1 Tax=Lomentospora prolificans TaxID=41688 RepID=A0A2N3NCA1_9PEZI|nr:hypothetical protein jhhlp_004683 [Lomentospora prolificans]